MLNRREWMRRNAALGCAVVSQLPGCGANAPPPADPSNQTPQGIGAVSAPPTPMTMLPRGILLNDRQSRLNATSVLGMLEPKSVDDLQAIIQRANQQGIPLSVSGGRFAMGGQQFGQETLHLDTSASLDRILELDQQRGLLRVQGAVMWPAVLAYLRGQTPPAGEPPWTIRQKQAGVNRVTLAGAVSSNIHGRGLRFAPFVEDIESLLIINAAGEAVPCDRQENAELFSLVVGGYGLFGVVAEATLRLAPQFQVQRSVEIIKASQLGARLQQCIDEGYVFGECELSADFSQSDSPALLVCGKPSTGESQKVADQSSPETDEAERANRLLLRHRDKQAAFDAHSQRLLATDGQVVWSDLQQMSDDFVEVHPTVDQQLGKTVPGTDVITELVVAVDQLAALLTATSRLIQEREIDVISAKVSLVEPDDVTFLRWAVERSACIQFCVHVDHSNEGLAKAADDARTLVQAALDHGGRYYPTYHRWPTRDQVLTAFPQFIEFLKLKLKLDPKERFQSQWYRHYKAMFQDELQV